MNQLQITVKQKTAEWCVGIWEDFLHDGGMGSRVAGNISGIGRDMVKKEYRRRWGRWSGSIILILCEG